MPIPTIIFIAITLIIYLKATKRQKRQVNKLAIVLAIAYVVSQFVDISFSVSI